MSDTLRQKVWSALKARCAEQGRSDFTVEDFRDGAEMFNHGSVPFPFTDDEIALVEDENAI